MVLNLSKTAELLFKNKTSPFFLPVCVCVKQNIILSFNKLST